MAYEIDLNKTRKELQVETISISEFANKNPIVTMDFDSTKPALAWAVVSAGLSGIMKIEIPEVNKAHFLGDEEKYLLVCNMIKHSKGTIAGSWKIDEQHNCAELVALSFNMEYSSQQIRDHAQLCLEMAESEDIIIQRTRVKAMEWRKMAAFLLVKAQRMEEKEALPVSENL